MSQPTTRVFFERAPTVEAVRGVFFASFPGWDLLEFGRLASRFESRYPRHEFKVPIGEPSQLGGQLMASLQRHDLGRMPVRCWFLDQRESDLIQVQENCFIHNWRKKSGQDNYPGYDVIHPRFIRDWKDFCGFVSDRGMPRPDVWKCELTYVDHFVRGIEWQTFSDLPKIYRLWRGMEAEAPLSALEFASFQVNYALRGGDTRLVFASQPNIRPDDGKEVLQLTITAMGKPASSLDQDILDWFDRAHEALVDGFLNFTTPEVQEHWR